MIPHPKLLPFETINDPTVIAVSINRAIMSGLLICPYWINEENTYLILFRLRNCSYRQCPMIHQDPGHVFAVWNKKQIFSTESLWPLIILVITLEWRHNERDEVSNHQPHDCLLERLFRRRSKKTSNLRVIGFCPVPGEFPRKGTVTWKMFPFDDVTMISRGHYGAWCRYCVQYYGKRMKLSVQFGHDPKHSGK